MFFWLEIVSYSATKHHKFTCLDHTVPPEWHLNCLSSPLSFRVSVKTFPTWLTLSTRYKVFIDVWLIFQWFSSHLSIFVLGQSHFYLIHFYCIHQVVVPVLLYEFPWLSVHIHFFQTVFHCCTLCIFTAHLLRYLLSLCPDCGETVDNGDKCWVDVWVHRSIPCMTRGVVKKRREGHICQLLHPCNDVFLSIHYFLCLSCPVFSIIYPLLLLLISSIFSSSYFHSNLYLTFITLLNLSHLFSQHLAVTRDYSSDCMRRYSWTPDTMDHSAHNTVSSPIHSG